MSHKQKIVLAINSLQGAGAERFVLTIGKAFDKLGFEVHILCFDPKIEYEIPSFLHYHLIKYKNFRWLPDNKLRYNILARYVDNYILSNIGMPIMLLSNLPRSDRIFSHSRLTNILFVIHNTLSQLHKFDNTKSIRDLELFKKIYATHPCVCVSEGSKKDFVKFFRPPRVTAILNPIDKPDIQLLADEFMPEFSNYILHIGSFKPAKRHDILLKAYANSNKTLPLVLLGKGELKSKIEAEINKLNLEKQVILKGFCKNPYPYIKHATFQVLASDWEGLPLVIPEALALNTPVISTDCPSGPSELLPANNLVPVGDIVALTQKLNRLMAQPQAYIAPFDDNLLPENIAKQYLDFMQVNYLP